MVFFFKSVRLLLEFYPVVKGKGRHFNSGAPDNNYLKKPILNMKQILATETEKPSRVAPQESRVLEA